MILSIQYERCLAHLTCDSGWSYNVRKLTILKVFHTYDATAVKLSSIHASPIYYWTGHESIEIPPQF